MKWLTLFWLPFVAGCRTTKFLQEEGVALQNHVIKTVTATAPIICHWNCVDEPLCFSINVRKLPSGRVTCELNNSSKTADPQDLISSAGSQYHYMAEVEYCTTEQCVYKDVLPDGWYRFGSKLIKLFPERKTWEQARQFCQSIGGELASINSDDENEFVYNLFAQIKAVKANTAKKDENQNQIISHWILDGTDSDVNLVNGARYEEEEDGVKCLYLNGSGARATTPAVSFGQTSFTIASWVKLQSPVTPPSTIYSYWTNPLHFLVEAYYSKKLRFIVKNNKGQSEPYINNGSAPIDKWFHVAAVLDRAANEAYLYLDGQKVGTQAVQSDTHPVDDNSRLFYDIGFRRDKPDKSLRGYLRDLMIIQGAVADEELLNMTDPNNEPIDGIWIGLNDITTEGTFHWLNSTHVTYTKWAFDQPDNQNGYQDCVEMTVDNGAWDDTKCAKQLPFVCEKET